MVSRLRFFPRLSLCLGLFLSAGFALCAQPAAESARDQRWAARDTPPALAAFAADFTARLNLGADFMHNGLRGRAPLRPVADAIKAGRHEEAMTAFVAYYYAKLLDPVAHGLDPADLSPYAHGTAGYGQFPPAIWKPDASSQEVIAQADALLSGSIEVGDKRLDLTPGKVNWNHPLPYGAAFDPAQPELQPAPDVASGAILMPLARAFALTGDKRYHQTWVELIDDWSLNAFPFQSIHPLFIPSRGQDTFATAGTRLVKVVAELRRIMPAHEAPLPPRVLAQVLGRAFGDYPLAGLVYLRSNPHNWTPFPGLMFLSMLGDEFTSSQFFFRENKRRNIEDNAVTQNLRDGTENQQCPWYNHNYANTISAIRLMEARARQPSWREVSWIRDAWTDARWLDEIRENQRDHATYLIRLRTPQGEWPIPYRGGDKRQADTSSRVVSPEAYADPVNRAVLSAVHAGSGIAPPHHSEWFPYAGYSVMRDGWGALDGYAAMFASPRPGAYGGFRSRSNNNVFSLAAAGQDLLVDDTTGHYMYPTSPIRVGGRDQNFHAAERIYRVMGVASHKSYLQRAWTEPADWRWHASERFNVVEGIYQGPYIQAADRVSDVAHQRVAIHVRGARLWIITDRLASSAAHTFEQRWMFPVSGKNSPPAFAPGDFVMDESAQLIATESKAEVVVPGGRQTKANLSLHQIGSVPLSYSNKIVPHNASNRYMPYGRNEVTASWRAEGPSQVVTLAHSRPDGAARLASFTPRRVAASGDTPGVVGFAATTPDGREVLYLSAERGFATLALRGVEAEAQALLLAGDHGIVLGARSLRIAGAPVELTGADFEFALNGGRLAGLTPIHRPIAPVVIGPEQTAFAGSIEVTLASRTPGVELRYTLDGSEPTPASPLYTDPVRITRTTVVKARAYRPGVTANPITTDGTHATPISSAYFQAEAPLEPASPVRVSPGVRFTYRQGEWTDLLVRTEQLAPRVSEVVPALFDLTKVPADNPPVADAPAPRANHYAVHYEGYLDIPRDGVYTFHAPEEYIYPDLEAGYDLRLWVGEKKGAGAFANRVIGMHEWYPSTRMHAFGSWSLPLKKGLHPFKLVFVDYRTDAAVWLNRPGLRDYIWTGSTPDLRVSGPGLDRQPIPAAWLKH